MEELFKLLAKLMVYLLLGAHFGVSAHFCFLARELSSASCVDRVAAALNKNA